MIEENAASDFRGGIDVGLEFSGGAALDVIGKILAAVVVEPVRKAVRLDSVEALEVEQRIDEARGRGIAIEHGDKIGAERIAEVGIETDRFEIGLPDQIAGECRVIEPFRDAMHNGIFKPAVMQHR